jgi:hypothetical protein
MENGASTTYTVAHAIDTLGFGTFQVIRDFVKYSGSLLM